MASVTVTVITVVSQHIHRAALAFSEPVTVCAFFLSVTSVAVTVTVMAVIGQRQNITCQNSCDIHEQSGAARQGCAHEISH